MAVYYNVGANYEVVGRITNGTVVECYVLRNKLTGAIAPVRKEEVEQLALNKQIYNCSAQIYNNIVNLKGINCKLSQLPRYDYNGNIIIENDKCKTKNVADLRIVGKAQNGRTITHYYVIEIGKQTSPIKMTKQKTVELAQSGRFVNAKAQMNGAELMLRGANGENLTQLPIYN